MIALARSAEKTNTLCLFVMLFLLTSMLLIFSENLRSVSEEFTLWFVSSIDGTLQPYWFQTPAGYNSSLECPLLIFLRRWGDPIDYFKTYTTFDEEASSRGWLLASPYCRGESWMNQTAQQDVLDMIDALKSNYSVDPSRIYIVGASMGGGAALTFAANNPDVVAAVADIFGVTNFIEYYYDSNASMHPQLQETIYSAFGGTPEDVPFTYQRYSSIYMATNFLNIPVYITHGTIDDVINVTHSRNLYNQLLKIGVEVVYDEVQGMGHSPDLINTSRICDFFKDRVLNANPMNLMITADESGDYYWAHIMQDNSSMFAELNVSRTPDIVVSEENIEKITLNLSRMGIDPIRDIMFSLSWAGETSVILANYNANSTGNLKVYVSLNGSECPFVYDEEVQTLTISVPYSADTVSCTFVVKCSFG